MQNLTMYIVGAFLSSLVFPINNWLGVTEIERALFTRKEKVKHLISELLIGGIIIFPFFIICLILFDEILELDLLVPGAALSTVASIMVGFIIYMIFIKPFLKRKTYYYFYDKKNNKRYYILNRLNDTEIIVSETHRDKLGYIQEVSFFYGMPVKRKVVKK